MDPNKLVIGTAFYLGMSFAILLLSGWRLMTVGGVLGALFFLILVDVPRPWIVELILGAGMGSFISWLGSLGKHKLGPYLRPYIDPDSWEIAAARSPLSPDERLDRLTLANSAAAGASAFGLLSLVLFTRKFWEEMTVESLLASLVIAWFGISFLDLVTGKGYYLATESTTKDDQSERSASTHSIYKALKVGIVVLVLAVLMKIFEDLLEKGVTGENKSGYLLLMLNSLTAGVVTYYWIAAVQYRESSVARASAVSSTMLGVVLTFIPSLLIYSPDPNHPGYAIFIFPILFALFFGILLFGLYAYAGGWAIGFFRRVKPVALRVMLGLIPVAILYTLILVLWMRTERYPLTPHHWLQHFMAVAGWGLGLWLNKRTERILGG